MIKLHLAVIVPVLALAAAFVPARAAEQSQVMVALKALPAQSDKFRSMMSNLSASQFKVVSASSAMSAGEEAAFEASVKKNASAISDLRYTLTHTTVIGPDGVLEPLKKVLSASNITIDQVIAVYVGRDGQITLFYQ